MIWLLPLFQPFDVCLRRNQCFLLLHPYKKRLFVYSHQVCLQLKMQQCGNILLYYYFMLLLMYYGIIHLISLNNSTGIIVFENNTAKVCEQQTHYLGWLWML